MRENAFNLLILVLLLSGITLLFNNLFTSQEKFINRVSTLMLNYLLSLNLAVFLGRLAYEKHKPTTKNS